MTFNPTYFIDAYKISHYSQYPKGTEIITSNLTPRGSRIPGVNHVVFFGLQYFIKKYLIDTWEEYFFQNPTSVEDYHKLIKQVLGPDTPYPNNLKKLYRLGHLPISIRALPEGTRVPMRVPVLTIQNTDPDFYWLTNFLETQLSCVLWKMSTSATIADVYKQVFNKYADSTGAPKDFVQWQGHDFSARGMSGIEDMLCNGAAHLTSFTGSDTIGAIPFLKKYYYANDTDLLCGSVPALEHAVVCANGMNEETTLVRLMTEVVPQGILSYVADTWDFWSLITVTLPKIKNVIMGRNGKLVIRPDSGDPVQILCGNPLATTSHEKKGLIEVLWELFGGTVNEKGYKVLDSHIGTIYGDSITLERQENILRLLKEKGFASSNVVLGIGSYTYQYVTRDTFGFAVKATHAVVNGDHMAIFKSPKTDSGIKKSAKGLIKVVQENNTLKAIDEVCTQEFESSDNLLKPVYHDGIILRTTSINEIRNRLK